MMASMRTSEDALKRGWVLDAVHPNVLVHPLTTRCSRVPFCNDCKKLNPTYYMVKPEVWALVSANQHRRLFLCLNCLSVRLGRDLTIHDFTNAHINDTIHFGFKLGQLSNGSVPNAVDISITPIAKELLPCE